MFHIFVKNMFSGCPKKKQKSRFLLYEKKWECKSFRNNETLRINSLLPLTNASVYNNQLTISRPARADK